MFCFLLSFAYQVIFVQFQHLKVDTSSFVAKTCLFLIRSWDQEIKEREWKKFNKEKHFLFSFYLSLMM
jgi:hypothetical protein